MHLFLKNNLTNLDNRAIIINCIIIAYYALLKIMKYLEKKFFRYIFYIWIRDKTAKQSRHDRNDAGDYFECSE